MRYILIALLVSGCVTRPMPEPVAVTYEVGINGEVYPIVDGVAYQLTEDEKRKQVQAIVNEYCQ